eukprot:5290019-Pleurochrysis_carterae.AAC.1
MYEDEHVHSDCTSRTGACILTPACACACPCVCGRSCGAAAILNRSVVVVVTPTAQTMRTILYS